MYGNRELINKFIEIIDTEEISTKSLIAFADSIMHDEGGILYDYGADFIKLLLDILSRTDNKEDELHIIENIMLSVGTMGYSQEYYCKKFDLDFTVLFDRYIELFHSGAVYTNKTSEAIDIFICFGVSPEYAVECIINNMPQNSSLAVLKKMRSDRGVWYFSENSLLEKYPEINKQLIQYHNIDTRIYIFYAIMIVTHPEYADMYRFTEFEPFPCCYDGMFDDFDWITRSHLSEKERAVVEKIKDIMKSVNDPSEMLNYKNELRGLFDNFCGGRDIADIIFGNCTEI